MRCYLGVDPGMSGASVLVIPDENFLRFVYHSETEADISSWYSGIVEKYEIVAMLEKVSAMPKQGVTSTFKFGQSFGFLRGLLTAHQIPFEFVSPQRWQKALQCQTGGDKNVTKAAAQRLMPGFKFTHKTADAFLLAKYAQKFGIWREA
jgi:Holliday junction resolvasome RuvABC endonuclease subunit